MTHGPLEEVKSHTLKALLSSFRTFTQYGHRYDLACEAEREVERRTSRDVTPGEGCSVTDGQREAPPDSDGSLAECNAYVTTANNSRNNTTAVCCALLSSRNTYCSRKIISLIAAGVWVSTDGWLDIHNTECN